MDNILAVYLGMAKVLTDINRLKWSKITEGEIGSVFQSPKSANVLAIPR